jgi:signal transduction histidine kinase
MTTSIVTITIEDTGRGMSLEFVDRILATPFTEANDLKVRFQLA